MTSFILEVILGQLRLKKKQIHFWFEFRLIVTLYDLRCTHGRDANIYIYILSVYIYNHLYHILYIYVVCLNCKYHLIISQQHHFTINVRPWSNNKAPSFDFSVATCIPGQIFGSQGTWVDDRETPGKLRVS